MCRNTSFWQRDEYVVRHTNSDNKLISLSDNNENLPSPVAIFWSQMYKIKKIELYTHTLGDINNNKSLKLFKSSKVGYDSI